MGLDPAEVQDLVGYLRSVPAVAPSAPQAILAVSAHWEAPVPTLMTGENPPLYFDYYGFPPASYELTWPAPGAPSLAPRVEALLAEAGFETARDPERGYDHGTFVPLKVAWPGAEVPVLQLSLVRGLDPGVHLRLGRALMPLRDEGVLIVGSGMTYHDLRGFGRPGAAAVSEAFDAWLEGAVTAEPEARDARLAQWTEAPRAREAHPREEHLIPLMVAAGAAGEDRGQVAWRGRFLGVTLSSFHFG
jgi:aromatic ring-opening dioxygenase catalytic subunit (LigB family)